MIVRTRAGVAVVAAALSCGWILSAQGQQPAPPPDTLQLGALQEAAVLRDPRGRQFELLGRQSELRQRSLDAEQLPALSVLGQGQYQSDVATIPIELPGGVTPPAPPNDTYDAHLAVRQRLYDPSLHARREVENARLAESRARVRSSLYELRQSVNETFFAVLLLQSQAAELEAGIADLEAQLRVAVERVSEGAALPGEAASLEAALLQRRQALDRVTAEQDATTVTLSDLTGETVGATDALAIPNLAAEVARARAAPGEQRGRPEHEQFELGRQLIDRQRATIAAGERPRLSAFGRAGYGRPGLNPLAREFDSYWLSGIQVEWAPWSWGTTRRERDELALQREILDTEEAAFDERIRRSALQELASIDRIERSLVADEQIVELRERILQETVVRFSEEVVTSAEYVDRETDLLEARLTRIQHQVELARAHARFLTLIGSPLP
jgi:outer membrane protein TolC